MSAPGAVDAVSERIEHLLDELAHADAETASHAEQAVAEVLALHAQALARLLALADDHVADAPALAAALGDDELVAGVLLLHGLHPVPAAERIRAAVAPVERHLGDGDGVRLEVTGASTGTPPPAAVHRALEEAVRRAAPEVASVDVLDRRAAFVPLDAIGLRSPAPSRGTGA